MHCNRPKFSDIILKTSYLIGRGPKSTFINGPKLFLKYSFHRKIYLDLYYLLADL